MGKERQGKKTNAVREIEGAGVEHRVITFECPEAISGVEVAGRLGENPERVFKTLVTQGKSGAHYVFMVPVAEELDLKKAAAAVGEKSVAMVKSKELFPLTGYVHGGCSPIGMKTKFRTVIDETAELSDRILFSGGRIGCQVEMAPEDLKCLVGAETADVTVGRVFSKDEVMQLESPANAFEEMESQGV
ncbi:MAG: Cys-tRNA(Pro) deacylase [Kiritimatiellae bacterium]|nr:Cys-tRNA(Pro) deacylase [Kiritimatiellia bacterium]